MQSLGLGTCESLAVLQCLLNTFMQVMHAVHQLAAWQTLDHLRLSSAKTLAQPRHSLSIKVA